MLATPWNTLCLPIGGHVDEFLDSRIFEDIFLSGTWFEDDVVGE